MPIKDKLKGKYHNLEESKVAQKDVDNFLDELISSIIASPEHSRSEYKVSDMESLNIDDSRNFVSFCNELASYVNYICWNIISVSSDKEVFYRLIKVFINDKLKKWMKEKSKSYSFKNIIEKYADSLKNSEKITSLTSQIPEIMEYRIFLSQSADELHNLGNEYKNLYAEYSESKSKLNNAVEKIEKSLQDSFSYYYRDKDLFKKILSDFEDALENCKEYLKES